MFYSKLVRKCVNKNSSEGQSNPSIAELQKEGVSTESPVGWNNNYMNTSFPNEDVLLQQRLLLQNCDRYTTN